MFAVSKRFFWMLDISTRVVEDGCEDGMLCVCINIVSFGKMA